MYLSYFPDVCDDELLYSLIARFLAHSGGASGSAAAILIFGTRQRATSIDLPGRCIDLYNKIPVVGEGSFEEFVNKTTLLPYYSAFSTRQTRSEIMTAVRSGASNLHLRLGISGFAVDRPAVMRFCPACFRDMKTKFGEAYWRRVHQMPGVLVCPDHGIPLRPSCIELPLRKRLEYRPADERSCPPDAPVLVDVRDSGRLKLLFDIAVASAGVLRSPPPARTSEEIALDYRARAERAGLTRAGSSLRQFGLNSAFMAHYRDILPMLGVAPPNRTGLGWVAAMLRRHRNAYHPLQHILVDLFLKAAIASARYASGVLPSAFGAGPWACRNPLCELFGTNTINDAKWHHHKGRMIGIFECGCGYSYTRGVDIAGNLGPPRYRAFGPTLEAPLRAWIASGRSMWSIGQQLGLCAKTVAREAISLGIATIAAVSVDPGGPRFAPPSAPSSMPLPP